MTTTIIVTFCILILLSYSFDISGKKTRIPGVILLLTLGMLIRWISSFFGIIIPNIQPLIPVLGTIGLILIVLEGSLDLGITADKFPLIRSTLLSAFALFALCTLIFSAGFMLLFHASFLHSLVNAIPLSIISSTVAISSVANLDEEKREFVIYESSFSDILGVLFFNYFTINNEFTVATGGQFIIQLLLILVISFGASFLLGMLLERISHHIKAVPIITLLILIYMLAKIINLPSLLLILVFGLVLRNIGLFRFSWLYRFVHPEIIAREIVPFKHLVGELTFVVRSLFFILFGFYTDVAMLLNPESLAVALALTGFILLSRFSYFSFFQKKLQAPVFYVAPRGLITILLYLSIPEPLQIPRINDGMLTQVIYLTAFVMMFGLMSYKNKPQESSEL
ncbi:MAG: cation:proton antiporter [Bacteroidetes bacterium]|nr:cation:proton antiporter [Bacteroidota bacterium]